MIPNNTKSGIISIIRFSGEKKTLYFFSGLPLTSIPRRRGDRGGLIEVCVEVVDQVVGIDIVQVDEVRLDGV